MKYHISFGYVQMGQVRSVPHTEGVKFFTEKFFTEKFFILYEDIFFKDGVY